MSTLSMDYYPINASTQQAEWEGSSVEAKKLFAEIQGIFVDIKPSSQRWVFNELEELSINAAHYNWDSLGSAPLDADTYQVAKKFISALPTSLPAPELTVDRDGEVNFDWFGSGGQIFSASLRKDGRIAFAGQISVRNRQSGVEEFNDSVPKRIVESVKSIFPK